MTQLQFDAQTVAPSMGMDAIPAGWYKIVIADSDMKPTKDGSGSYLELQMKVIEGPYSGAMVISRLNLRNANQKAMEIAYKELSTICHAVNLLQIQDSRQLHNLPMYAKLAIDKDKSGEYDDKNIVKNYKPITFVPEVANTTAATAPTAAAPAAAAPAGWGAPPAAAPVATPVAAPAAAPLQPQPWAPVAPPAAAVAPPAVPPTRAAPPWGTPPPVAAPPAAPPTEAVPPWQQPR